MKKRLYLCTESFPYGIGEKSFVLPELEELIKHYDVTIISHASLKDVKDKKNETLLERNIKVVNVDIKLQWYKRLWYFISFFFSMDGIHELKLILKENERIFFRIYQSIGFYALAMENFKMMQKKGLLSFEESGIYYTYWYFYYTYSLTKHRSLFPNMKVITRTHRFDLYEDAYRGGRQPFKEIMDVGLDRIFFVSEQGKNYYLKKYRLKNVPKYLVSRLGTIRVAEGDYKGRHDPSGRFRIVSCSSVTPRKRVDLIVEALSLMEEQIEWIHFGAGSDYNKTVKLAERLLKTNGNVVYSMKGYVSNEEVLKYYSMNFVDCFITTSSSEGLPVSVQEAMSFGIPIVATKVGGISELLKDNGVLLNSEPSKEEVAAALKKIIHADTKEYEQLRHNSYSLWERKYNAEVNRVAFVNMLEEI